jgi:hypothetical protein
VFLGLLDPDPLVRGMDPDPSIIISKNSKENLDFLLFCAFFLTFLPLKNDVKVPSNSNMQKNIFFKLVFVGILKVNNENRSIRIH